MDRRYRISSPKVFETVLTRSKMFRGHDWLFDIHPGIVSSFRPDIRIAFASSAARAPNQFGHVAQVNRQLVAHPTLIPDSGTWSLSEFESQPYITIAHDDEASIFASGIFASGTDVFQTPLSLLKVFRANDVLAAELAVKLRIGYAALPEFLINDDVSHKGPHLSLLAGWNVSPTNLRIISSGAPNISLSKLHETLLSSLAPFVNTPWRSFGRTQNIIPLVTPHE